MTKNYKKWSIIAGTSIGAILLVSVLALGVLTPQAEAGIVNENGNGLPSSPCPPDDEVQHWDKIVFEIKKDESKTIPKDLLKKQMDLKILDTPGLVVDLEQEVANAVGEQFGVDPADLEIKIKDVLYQTVSCAASGPAGPAGATGPAGSVQILQVTERLSSFVNAKGGGVFTFASVSCVSGELLVGGGFDANDASTPIIVDNRPNGNGWLVGFKQSGATAVQVRASALCATLI